MTGIPGFPARAVWAKGEVGHKSTGGSGGYPAEWHDTADGRFEWKGDTSSDESMPISALRRRGALGATARHGAQSQKKTAAASVAAAVMAHGRKR